MIVHKNRDIIITNIQNMFIQTLLELDGKDRIIIKITGVLVNILIKECSQKYSGYVVYKKRNQRYT